MQKMKYWKMYKYLQPEESNGLRYPCFCKKSDEFMIYLLLLKIRRICEILAITKNQADLWNPCVYRKSGGFMKSLRLQKIRRTIESLRALKSPRLAKNPRFEEKPASEEKPAGLEKQAACLLFRLGGISSFWLLPGLTDELSFRSS